MIYLLFFLFCNVHTHCINIQNNHIVCWGYLVKWNHRYCPGFGCNFECVILRVKLCCLANHLLHIFVISEIFLTLITERGESIHRWSDDETWRLLIHISSTVAFQAALWWNPSRFIWPQGRDYVDERSTDMSEDWAERGVCGGLSGLSPPLGLEQFSIVFFHLYCVCGRPRMREN